MIRRMIRRIVFWVLILGAAGAAFFVWGGRTENLRMEQNGTAMTEEQIKAIEEAKYQKPLPNPPENIKAIYITSWVAGTPKVFDPAVKIVGETEVNALVIDIKDYSGYVAYRSDLADVKKYQAEEEKIKDFDGLVRRLHKEGIYIIARMAVFQDPRLAKARPEWAVKNAKGEVWKDGKGLSWMDLASKEVWDYNIAIAKDALGRGVDEVNFDYVRFPSDGEGVEKLVYPVWDNKEEKHLVIRRFFAYLREQLPAAKISADVFGQTTVDSGDVGIGQKIEDAYDYFDYVAPMVYPSHFHEDFIGYKNPGAHPYEVVKYALESGLNKIARHEWELDGNKVTATTTVNSLPMEKKFMVLKKIRPWLQDFDLGAVYTAEMVQKQMQAVRDAGLPDTWMIWNWKNDYRKEIFDNKEKK